MHKDSSAASDASAFWRSWVRRSQDFSHPLLRIAAKQEDVALAYRDVRRALRVTLDRNAPAARRIEAAHDVLTFLPGLRLDPANENVFRREFLLYVCAEAPSPLLLQHLLVAELQLIEIAVEPAFWVNGHRRSVPLTSLDLPHLISCATPDNVNLKGDPSEAPRDLPEGAARVCAQAIELTTRAAADDSLASWSASDCEAAVVLLVLGVLYGELVGRGRPRVDPVSGLAFFEGVGLGLWQALAAQAQRAEDYRGADLLWDGVVQQRVLLHLRGQASVGQLEVSAPAAKQPAKAADAVAPSGLRVIPGVIPPGAWKDDVAALKPYQRLREPVPVARMPSPQAVDGILAQLAGEFPWAAAVIRELGNSLRTASLLGVQQLMLPQTLLVGPPGAGKSRLVRRLGELLGLPYLPLTVGGSSDAKLLLGTARGWGSAEASPLVRLLLQSVSASGLVLLDELDKVRADTVNAPAIASILLGLLEPETASRWYDGFLQTACDLSHVSFWATANSLSSMSEPLLSRFTVIYMPAPEREHLPVLVRGITRDWERRWGLPEGVLPEVPASAWGSGGRNVRDLKRLVLRYLNGWAEQHRSPGRLH